MIEKLYELLASVIREQTPEQTSQYVIEHFDVIRRCVLDTVSPEKQPELLRLIDLAKEDIRKAAPPKKDVADKTCRYEAEIEQCLDSLFKKNNRRVFYLVRNFVEHRILDSVQDALENGEYKLYLQPKVDMAKDGEMVGAEVLISQINIR